MNNLIVKFVEDDIVLSVNVKSVEYHSVNSIWQKSFIDLTPEDLVSFVCAGTGIRESFMDSAIDNRIDSPGFAPTRVRIGFNSMFGQKKHHR